MVGKILSTRESELIQRSVGSKKRKQKDHKRKKKQVEKFTINLKKIILKAPTYNMII